MNTFTYNDISADIETLNHELTVAGQTEGGESHNANTEQLIVYTDLDEATTNAVVAAHDPDSLFAQKVTKVNVFDENTLKLVNNGLPYDGVVMGVGGDDKSFYTSLASDDDNAGVTVTYPLQIPGLISNALVIESRTELDSLITATNDRLIYLYEDQVNGDGSKGLIAYSKEIFSAPDINALDAIVDTRQ